MDFKFVTWLAAVVKCVKYQINYRKNTIPYYIVYSMATYPIICDNLSIKWYKIKI